MFTFFQISEIGNKDTDYQMKHQSHHRRDIFFSLGDDQFCFTFRIHFNAI